MRHYCTVLDAKAGPITNLNVQMSLSAIRVSKKRERKSFEQVIGAISFSVTGHSQHCGSDVIKREVE